MAAETTVAVIGASARAAAASLQRAGRQVIAADLFADADLARECNVTQITPYPAGFTSWLAAVECDEWLYTGALENYPELVDQLTAIRPLRGHSGKILRRVRDPLQLQAVLSSASLCFPKTQRASQTTPCEGEWIGKTYQGSSGSGVGVDDATFLQQRIQGTPLSAVFHGSRVLGITHQLVGEAWAGAAEFKYCGSIGPWPLSPENLEQLRRLGEVLSREFELSCLYGVDLILDGANIWTIEVNPRYTAAVEIVERAYGVSAFDTGKLGRASENSLPHQEEGVLHGVVCCGKATLFAKAPLTISAEMSTALLVQAGSMPWPKLADIPVVDTEIATSQPVLTLFAEAESCQAVAEQLARQVRQIELQLYGGTLPCV